MENAVFKFPVMENANIFDTQIVACEDRCDRGNTACLVDQVTVKFVYFFDRAGFCDRNGIAVIFGGGKEIEDLFGILIFNQSAYIPKSICVAVDQL